MKPLAEYTEAELLGASDVILGLLVDEYIIPKNYQCEAVIDLVSTGNGMLEVLEAMKMKDIYLSLHARPDGYSCETWKEEKRVEPWEIRHTSLPRAVAVAALLVIKSQ